METKCTFFSCTNETRHGYIFCQTHDTEYVVGRIDKCPSCGWGKVPRADTCQMCTQEKMMTSSLSAVREPLTYKGPALKSHTPPDPEWEVPFGPKEQLRANDIYVYVLKLSDNSFHVGRTKDLMRRLSEHQNNEVESTANKNPELVWFNLAYYTGTDGRQLEKAFKEMSEKNEPYLRQHIINLENIVKDMPIYKTR